MEYLEWKADGSLPKLHFLFEKETFFHTTLFAMTVIFLLKNILSTFQFDRPLHHSMPEMGGRGASWEREQSVSHIKRDQEALQLQFIRHRDVLFMELKSFGFSTTIFSVWFLAGRKKNFLPQKLFWKSSTSHSSPASWPSIQKHGTRQQLLVGIYFP